MTLSLGSSNRTVVPRRVGAATAMNGARAKRSGRSVLTALFVALIALAGGLISATSAAAHGGAFELQVSSDAAGGIAVFATYLEDGHIVTEIMDPVAMATSADGDTTGPVALISSPEGEGRWVSEKPFLGNGDWTVTVTTTVPEEATATVEFTVAPIAAPPEPEPTDTAADADANATGGGDVSEDTGMSVVTVAALVVGVALLVAALVVFLRKRRAPTT